MWIINTAKAQWQWESHTQLGRMRWLSQCHQYPRFPTGPLAPDFLLVGRWAFLPGPGLPSSPDGQPVPPRGWSMSISLPPRVQSLRPWASKRRKLSCFPLSPYFPPLLKIADRESSWWEPHIYLCVLGLDLSQASMKISYLNTKLHIFWETATFSLTHCLRSSLGQHIGNCL